MNTVDLNQRLVADYGTPGVHSIPGFLLIIVSWPLRKPLLWTAVDEGGVKEEAKEGSEETACTLDWRQTSNPPGLLLKTPNSLPLFLFTSPHLTHHSSTSFEKQVAEHPHFRTQTRPLGILTLTTLPFSTAALSLLQRKQVFQ